MRTVFSVLCALSLVAGTGCRDKDSANDLPDAGPADANASETTIQDVQSESMPTGTPVTLTGVVIVAIDTFPQRTGTIWLMDPAGGEYSGVPLFLTGSEAAGFAVGDLVDVSNVEKDEFAISSDTSGLSMTQLRAIENATVQITKVGDGTVPAPKVLNPWDLVDEAEAEKWEGVLVTFENVSVLSPPRNVSTNSPWIREMLITGPFEAGNELTELEDTLADGSCLASITGMVNYIFDYQILPRSPADIATGGSSCPAEEESLADCMDSADNDYDGFTDCADRSCQQANVDECSSDSTIVEIQDGTVATGSLVALTDVVVTAIDLVGSVRGHIYVADSGTAAQYNGVYLYRGSSPTELDAQILLGSTIDVIATVDEYNGLTELKDATLTFKATGPATLTPLVVPFATLADETNGEPYEGVLVTVENVRVQNADAGFGKFTVGDTTTQLIVDDTIYQHTATANECLTITGVMDWNGQDSERRLLPREAGDVQAGTCN